MENGNKKPVIKVSDFYAGACKTHLNISKKLHDKTRLSVLNSTMIDVLKSLSEHEKADSILKKVESKLNAEYEDSFFSFDWQKKLQIEDDVKVFERFLKWFSGSEILELQTPCLVKTEKYILSCSINMVAKKGDDVIAYKIFFKKANCSPNGRSVHTSTKTNLYSMCAKAQLERKYPKIKSALVFMFNDKDSSGNIGSFLEKNTKDSNIFIEDFKAHYDVDLEEFDSHSFLNKIDEVLETKRQPDCFNCSMQEFCSADTIKTMKITKSRESVVKNSKYVVPNFTESQKKVVLHEDGAMLVVAPPGSGKTAACVGNIKHLLDIGVDGENILAITFTNDAAGEILERVKSFCKKDELPAIMTLNSLGMKILLRNKELIGEVKLLSTAENMRIIKNLVELQDKPISGFKYGQLTGRTGLWQTVSNRLEDLSKIGEEKFREKYADIGEEFYELATQYQNIIKAQNYITYDEQISLVNTLFAEHPEIRKQFSMLYQHVIVDEFQDINEPQKDMIYSIASHHNLVCVGDDDQNIYGFRGGTNKYMLEFRDTFADSEVVIFNENFRSKKGIVDAATKFISKNQCRIAKDVVAVRGDGKAPTIISGTQSASEVESVVKEWLERGYNYSDIAVLATKNATLEELARGVSFNAVLGKSYLINNPVYRIFLDILYMYYRGINDRHLLHYLTLMEVAYDFETSGSSLIEYLYKEGYPDIMNAIYGKSDDALYNALALLNLIFRRLRDGAEPLYILDILTGYFDIEGSDVEESLEKMITSRHIRSCNVLFETMQYMMDMGDDTRLEPDTSESVLFTTSHESKGCEWKCVLLIDDFKEDGSEETNRLYFVAMTRAKDELTILTKGQTLLTA